MRQILSALHEHLAPAQEEQGLLELDLDAVGLEHGGGDPGEQFDPHAQAQALDAFVSDRIQQAVAPLAQEMHDKWLPGEYRDLAAEFPEMGAARCLTLRARWPTRRAGHRRWPRAWG